MVERVEAVERLRVARTVNGGTAPAGLREIRDLFLSVARGRQEPTNDQVFDDLLDALLVTPRLLKTAQVATALACSTRTAERLIGSGALTSVSLTDGSCRVRVADLDRFVDSLDARKAS